jgi:hypothetical protein
MQTNGTLTLQEPKDELSVSKDFIGSGETI